MFRFPRSHRAEAQDPGVEEGQAGREQVNAGWESPALSATGGRGRGPPYRSRLSPRSAHGKLTAGGHARPELS